MAGRVVVLTPNWLGDAVMALPAIGAVRRHHPADTLVVAARSSSAALFRMVPGVDEVVSLGDGRGWRGAAAEVRALAATKADVAILLPNSFRSAWIARRAGIRERWGFSADLRGRLLTRRVARPRGRMHQASYYQALVAGLGIAPELASGPITDPAVVVAPEEARARAAALLSSRCVSEQAVLVGMAPGAAYGHAKQWPPDRYARLAVLLRDSLGVVSVLVGTRADRPAGVEIERAAARDSGALLNLIGQTDLPLLVGLMTRCRAFVSNDSGAMHLAAAAGLPVTAVFGSSDERGTAPLACVSPSVPRHEILSCRVWCRPCMLRECPIDHRCMTGIDPERVAEAVGRQLRRE